MLSLEIRRRFLHYFKHHGHTIVPSSSVVPHNDPTLLFINAGMNQFKDLFLGQSQRYTRATSSQKCIRVGGKHNDLENVGHTSRHLTFFEMLGNFSFGDYFKKEAIAFAWEVSTEIFGFDPERIWATVFKEDDEAAELWLKYLPQERICRFGEKDNFWMMGDTGPCGPCSELLYDRGPEWGDFQNPTQDPSGERFLEFWNLVFMQYDRLGPNELLSLPKKNIDTGAGLERVVSLKMQCNSVFETDILRALISEVEVLSCKAYPGAQDPKAAAFHVIADHLRSLAFAIADGVQPSNTDRGYILRKLVRRAVRYGKQLGFEAPFLGKVLPQLIHLMGEDFPEITQSKTRIEEILFSEEEAFFHTLRRGNQLLNEIIARSDNSKAMSAEDAFKLKDTYGLPLEEITLVAKDNHLSLDLERYALLEKEAKERSRKERKESGKNVQIPPQDLPATQFVREDLFDAKIVYLLHEGHAVNALHAGQEGIVVLDRSPFYGEKGGQAGDHGQLLTPTQEFAVTECQWLADKSLLHHGKVIKGTLSLGDVLHPSIDATRRQLIANNHTATHLLHWALQQVLGAHVRQAGSLVEADRLRFDFNHHKALTSEEIECIEDLVNMRIRENDPVQCQEVSYESIQNDGSIKQFFGDKYGAVVRVITAGPSKELCGGTHTSHTGQIGYFRIQGEASIAAGVRRIEAVTGHMAESFARSQSHLLSSLAEELKAPLNSVKEKLSQLIAAHKEQQETIKNWQQKELLRLADELVHTHLKKNLLTAQLTSEVDLRLFGQLMKGKFDGVAALAQVNGNRCQLLVQVCGNATHDANALLQAALKPLEGKGGGKKESAQGSGTRPENIDKAFEVIRTSLAT